jgi:heat shock protein HslJ
VLIRPRVLAPLVLLGVVFCAPSQNEPAEDTGTTMTITDRDWELVSLGEHDSPRGTQDRPVTIRFESADSRAGGFAGCNQFSAQYELSGDSLWFEPAISTKMLCPDVMDVETSFLGALERVTGYEATDSTLTLLAASEPVSRFRARFP